MRRITSWAFPGLLLICHSLHITSFCPTTTKSYLSLSPQHVDDSTTSAAAASAATSSEVPPTCSDNSSSSSSLKKECWYQYREGRWRRRLELNDLKVGQVLQGTKLKKNDILNGKTGPKVFFECGVGRIDPNGNWRIVNGMVRLGTRFSPKPSVIRKRVDKLNKSSDRELIELYVHKIRSDCAQLELRLQPIEEDITSADDETINVCVVPASTLEPLQELVGKVVRVEDYGVFVDVGANRLGLLHIQKVADLYGRYIDKSDGLVEAGLERGAKIRVSVDTNARKRLFFNFPADVLNEAEEEQKQKELQEENDRQKDLEQEKTVAILAEETSEEEDDMAAWADFAAAPDFNDDDYYYDDPKEEDEDRNIEDSLGMGSY